MKKYFRFFDFILLFIFSFCIAVSFFLAGKKTSGKMLSVKTMEGEFVYPLNKNAELEFKGNIGITHVVIRDGQAWVTESACENKNCIFMGKLSRSGDFAACLPNGVILTVEGLDEEFDAVAE